MDMIKLTPDQEQALVEGKIQATGENKVYWLCEAELNELNPFSRLTINDALDQAATLNHLLQTLFIEAGDTDVNLSARDREGIHLVMEYIKRHLQFLSIKQTTKPLSI